ncbi:MAG: DUF192 domain-containing protein [Acidobacteriota bacterium]
MLPHLNLMYSNPSGQQKFLIDGATFLLRTGLTLVPEKRLRVTNRRNGALLTTHGGIANTSELRRRGLLQHESLEEGDGLWIAPCEAVHCFGMKFAIDVVYLNKQKKILKLRPNLGRNRISFCLRAHSVLELPAGTIARTGTLVGDELEFEKV